MLKEAPRPSREDMRRFILNQLGEDAGGLTQGELLERFTHWYLSTLGSWFDADLDVQFIEELSVMRNGGRIMGRYVEDGDSVLTYVHQQTPHGWLAWVREKQDAERRATI